MGDSFLKNFLTVTEAAARMGLAPVTVRLLVRQGHLAAEKAGAAWLIPVSAIENFAPRPKGRPTKKKGK